MATMTFDLRVEMEDGTTYEVVADQRDLVRWERHPEGSAINNDAKVMQMLRFIAWSALQRQQLTDLKWPQFDRQLVESAERDNDDEEAGVPADAADPGRPAR